MNYDEMLNFLYNLGRMGSKLGLEPIREASQAFQNPEKNLKNVIHIAGTNGKGSVAAMLTSILRESGFSVGMYTSPHLVDFRERIQFNGEPISKEDFLRLFLKIKEKNLDLTFFEFTTLLAFLYFSEKKPDFNVIEVGLGGALDATNIVLPKIAVITNVSLDHTHFLGNTLELVTKNKCGIIKQNIPVITSNNNPPVIDIIKNICEKRECELKISQPYNGELSLKGQFQLINAGVAKEVAESLDIPAEKITNGLKKAAWPGRVEEKNGILFDGAHNPAGIHALAQYVKTLGKKPVIVFGVSEDKDYQSMLAELPEYKEIIFTQSKVKPLDPKKLRENVKTGLVEPDPMKALEKAKSLSKDLILVTGSIYLIGNIYQHFAGHTEKAIHEFI